MSVLDAIFGARETIETKRATDYSSLVEKLANDEPVDEKVAGKILDGAGKSNDELKADVEREQQRRDDFALIETEPDVRKMISTINRERTNLSEEYDAERRRIIQHYEPRIIAKQALIDAENRKLEDIRFARERLRQSAGKSTKDRVAEIVARLLEIRSLLERRADWLAAARDEQEREQLRNEIAELKNEQSRLAAERERVAVGV